MSGGTCEGTAYQEFGFQTAAVCVALGNYHNCGPAHRIAEEFVNVGDGLSMVRLLAAAAREMARFDAHTGKLRKGLGVLLRFHFPRRTVPPALVGLGVHVAVVAGEVAPLVDLQHHVVHGGGSPATGPQPRDVKFRVRPRRRRPVRRTDVRGDGHGSGVGCEAKFWNAEMTPFGSSRLRSNRSTQRANAGEAPVSPPASSSTTERCDTSSSGCQPGTSPADGIAEPSTG